jgi:caffeoyl-CoA O-methyltransferase
MDIIEPRIAAYLASLLPERPQTFIDMEAIAAEKSFPIVGPLVGSFLAVMAASIGAKRIVELGSGYGYSACWFSTVLPAGGRIVCTDGNPRNRDRALANLAALGAADRVDFRVGDALEIFATLDGDFDLVFCDIDKEGYPAAYEAAVPRVRPGGLLLFDNALWSGRMVEGVDDERTRNVVALNRRAFSDPRCRASIVPLRDGVLVARVNG